MCSFAAVLAGVQAGASIAGGMHQNKLAKQASHNAELSAIRDQQAASAEIEQIRYNNKRDLGTMRAAFGSRNVAFDSASMVDVLAEAAGNMDYAAVLKEHEGLLARYDGKVRAAQLRAQGRNALTSSILGAGLNFATQGVGTGWWKPGKADDPK